MNANFSPSEMYFRLMLGAALGDALGLPREGLTAKRAEKLFPGSLRHSLIGRFGFLSDDTEHLWMTALACIDAAEDPSLFERSLRSRLCWWLVRLPAGIGLATLRSILKLWLGAKTGVFSAGNGPAMRASIIGARYRDSTPLLCEFIRISTRLTHVDPKAEQGALAVALAAASASKPDFSIKSLMNLWNKELNDTELLDLLSRATECAESNVECKAFIQSFKIEKGVSGYVYCTVPAAMYCWLKHRDNFQLALETVMKLGGDTDSVGAIVGSLVGISADPTTIPEEWIVGLKDWPITKDRLRAGAAALSDHSKPKGLDGVVFGIRQLFRNLLFIPVVLSHGFRRLLPPY